MKTQTWYRCYITSGVIEPVAVAEVGQSKILIVQDLPVAGAGKFSTWDYIVNTSYRYYRTEKAAIQAHLNWLQQSRGEALKRLQLIDNQVAEYQQKLASIKEETR